MRMQQASSGGRGDVGRVVVTAAVFGSLVPCVAAMLEFVFRAHMRLASHAALLFAVGLFISVPVVRYRLRPIAWLPLAVFRLVIGLIGSSPSMARMVAVIFSFNTVAIFLYMASGFHPVLPKVFGIWTGMNIGIVMGMARQEELAGRSGWAKPGQWRPSRSLTGLCGLLVLLLELPCFWFAVAMGISLSHAVQAGMQSYTEALAPRASAYLAVIAPLLLCSAVAEAVAIRGTADAGTGELP